MRKINIREHNENNKFRIVEQNSKVDICTDHKERIKKCLDSDIKQSMKQEEQALKMRKWFKGEKSFDVGDVLSKSVNKQHNS